MTSTHPLDVDHAPSVTLRERLDRTRATVRRAVLRRRRLLAAVCTCVAVGAGLSATATPAAPTVAVLVAARDLPAGAVLEPEDLVRVDFRPGTPPVGAVDDPARLAGRQLAAPVAVGESITPVRLVGADLAASQPGRRAVPLRLPDPGMVGLLTVGDLIDLVATDPDGGTTSTIAADVPVLALPDDDQGGSTTASGLPGSLLVVGLTPAEVAPVASATLGAFVSYTWSER